LIGTIFTIGFLSFLIFSIVKMALMYVNAKTTTVETIPGFRVGRDKGKRWMG
jgi:hypothetical protein